MQRAAVFMLVGVEAEYDGVCARDLALHAARDIAPSSADNI